MIVPGDKAWIRARALNNALEKHPDPAISQENHEGIFGATGKNREYFDRYLGIRRLSGDPEAEHLVDVIAITLPYGKAGQRVGVRVSATLSDGTDAEVVVHSRSVESAIARKARQGIRAYEAPRLLDAIAANADRSCTRCGGSGKCLGEGRVPCTCTGVTVVAFFRQLGDRAR